MSSFLKGVLKTIVTMICAFGCALPIMIIWNRFMPEAFGVKEIGYWTSWWMYVFVSIFEPIDTKSIDKSIDEYFATRRPE